MSPATHPDWVARVVAIVALVVAAYNLFAGRSDTRWGRRAKRIDDLRVSLQQLLAALQAAVADVQQSRLLLWSSRNVAAIELIEDRLPVLADRRLRRRLSQLRTLCIQLRGEQPGRLASYEQSLPPDLTVAARLLPIAVTTASEALDRLHKITRRAPAS